MQLLRWLAVPVALAFSYPAAAQTSAPSLEPTQSQPPSTAPDSSLVITGATMLGAAYVPMAATAVWGAQSDETSPLGFCAVPIAGPIFIGGALWSNGGQLSTGGSFFASMLIVDGVVQAGGVVMMAAGFLRSHPVARKPPRTSISLVPMVGRDSALLGLGGSL